MESGKLTKINVSGSVYPDNNGTYVAPHVHDFTYTANDGKLTATCNGNGDCDYKTSPLTLTLTAPTSLVYDGNAKAFTFADGEANAWEAAGLELPTITYAAKSGSSLTSDKAVNAGSYKASITVDTDKTASLDFEITKATPYIKTNPESNDIDYGQKLADSTLAGGYAQVSSTNTTQVGGLFEWTNPDTVPGLDDSEVTEYDVTFTPADTNNYNTVSCKVKIKVNHTHAPVLVNGQAPTESASGWKDYYKCNCNALFEDENGTTPIENLDAWKAQDGNGYIAPLVHSITPVNGQDATDTEAGYKPYYECKNCGKYYEDDTGLVEIPDINAWKAEGGNGYIPPLAPESYTVTFNMNGHGTQIDAQTVKKGNKVIKPGDPTATGYTFGGWYKEAACTTAWNFGNETVTGNTTLFAKWTAKTYDVTFVGNFDGSKYSEKITETYDSNYVLPQKNPVRPNHSFAGWFTKAEGGDQVTAESVVKVTKNTTLYAHWTAYNVAPVELLTAKTSGSKAIKLSWNSVPGATKYVVYGNKCGKSFKKLKTTTGKTYTVKKISGKKLKAHKTYKFYVVAYTANGTVKSKSVHFITQNRNGKYANVKSIKAKVNAVTLSSGATKKIGATYKMYYGKKHIKKSHGAALRYISNCPTVATVNSSGVVTAKAAGTATIYIQDIGGKYCKTTVTVK